MVERRWVYAGLAVAAGVGLAKVMHRGPRVVPGKTRLLLLGDSLAVGLIPYIKCLASEQKVAFDGLAVVGTRIDQWAGSQKLVSHLASFQPTLVLVSLGTNDSYMRPDAAKRQAPYLETLLSKIAATQPELGWIGPPTLPQTSIGKPDPALRAMLQARIPAADWFSSSALSIPRGPDGLHPTARGYAGWAGAIWHWLSGPPGNGSCVAK